MGNACAVDHRVALGMPALASAPHKTSLTEIRSSDLRLGAEPTARRPHLSNLTISRTEATRPEARSIARGFAPCRRRPWVRSYERRILPPTSAQAHDLSREPVAGITLPASHQSRCEFTEIGGVTHTSC
jgi:hypothetical protein